MIPHQFRWMLGLFLTLLFGCSPAITPSTGIVTSPSPSAIAPAGETARVDFAVTSFPKARSQSLATSSDGRLYLIYGQDHSLYVARSADGGRTFGEAVLATGGGSVHVLPIEHPAIAVGVSGRVGIAWLEMPPDFNGATIWYASSEDGGQSFAPGQLVATESEGEVAMVGIALDQEENPVLAWLNGRALRFARSFDQGATFAETISIGDGSCECCQPQALVIDNEIHIAYRSLEPGSDKGDIRDIVMIHSTDGGQTFEPVARVSDAHWYLPACPIAGPSLAVHDGRFYVAWMDGRFEPPGTFSRGDIWLASSQDGGRTFSPNLRINADQSQHHTLPSIAVGPGGRVHIAWESQTQDTHEAFLYYTFSDDNGQTFASPQVIANNIDSSLGNPGKPILVVDELGHVSLAWQDRSGVRIAHWTDPK